MGEWGLPGAAVTVPQGGLGTIQLATVLRDRLVEVCLQALPRKAYGLLGGTELLDPKTVYPCVTNLRNAPEWTCRFLSFGEFYDDPDRGFVISGEESVRLVGQMARRRERMVGVFHSHRCREAYPSDLDIAMHLSSDVFAYIVSVVRPRAPELRVYHIARDRATEVPYDLV